MNPGLALIGVAVVAGAVIAVSARESRVAILGLVLALVTAPLLTQGSPTILLLAAQLVAAILVGYLLWVAVRAVPAATAASRTGWPAEALFAAAAAVIGWSAADAVGPGGPREALAAALALGVLSIGPLLARGDALQVGIGLGLGITAAELLRVGLAGPTAPIEQLVVSAVVVAAAAATALLADVAIAANGSLDVAAHPPAAARPAVPPAAPPVTRRRAATPPVARARR